VFLACPFETLERALAMWTGPPFDEVVTTWTGPSTRTKARSPLAVHYPIIARQRDN